MGVAVAQGGDGILEASVVISRRGAGNGWRLTTGEGCKNLGKLGNQVGGEEG